jgi:flagellar FliL protein
MKMLVVVLLAVIGVMGGAAAGWLLKPPPPVETACADPEHAEGHEGEDAAACEPPVDYEKLATPAQANPANPADASEFFRFERPFIVPIMVNQRVASLLVVSLSVEVGPGQLDPVTAREPRLRDALLRALFDHAYAGGFNGDFTADYVMRDLRRGLLVAARKAAGDGIRDVLVVDIMRQDQS